MSCPRCGSSRPIRPADMPSSVNRPGTIVPTPIPQKQTSIPSTNEVKNAISGLRYVPNGN